MLILGITGQPASGKDTVADYLKEKGFQKFTFGDILREEMTAIGLPLDRESMSKYSSEQKNKLGNDYLCFEILKRVKGNTTTPGVRSVKEVETFKKEIGEKFKLLTVQAPIEKRYEWIKLRQREGDNISYEKFKAQEEKERNDPSGAHEVDKVIELADFSIENNSTKEELFRKVDDLLLKL
jgi:dephospho-CoA kinase